MLIVVGNVIIIVGLAMSRLYQTPIYL